MEMISEMWVPKGSHWIGKTASWVEKKYDVVCRPSRMFAHITFNNKEDIIQEGWYFELHGEWDKVGKARSDMFNGEKGNKVWEGLK